MALVEYASSLNQMKTRRMEELINAHGQNVLFSNFLLTISTNVVPNSDQERRAVAQWLRDEANNLFDDLAMLNGTVLKPAGSANEEKANFDDDNPIERIRSRVSLEAGDQRGQMHMHVLIEVAHLRQESPNNWGSTGVHVNVKALRDYLNGQIHLMGIAPGRLPQKIYVNSRLITSRDNPSAKWLTLAYLNKQRDNPSNGQAPRNLVADRLAAPAEEQNIHRAMVQTDEVFEKNYGRDEVFVAEPREAGGTAPNSPVQRRADTPPAGDEPRFASEESVQQPMRFAPARRARRPIGAEQTTSSYTGGELNVNAVWNQTQRRKARREKEKQDE